MAKEKYETKAYAKDGWIVQEGGPAYVFDIAGGEPMTYSYAEACYAPFRTCVILFAMKEITETEVVFYVPRVKKTKKGRSIYLPDESQYLDYDYGQHDYAVISNPGFKEAKKVTLEGRKARKRSLKRVLVTASD
jgi:hypothetical protein